MGSSPPPQRDGAASAGERGGGGGAHLDKPVDEDAAHGRVDVVLHLRRGAQQVSKVVSRSARCLGWSAGQLAHSFQSVDATHLCWDGLVQLEHVNTGVLSIGTTRAVDRRAGSGCGCRPDWVSGVAGRVYRVHVRSRRHQLRLALDESVHDFANIVDTILRVVCPCEVLRELAPRKARRPSLRALLSCITRRRISEALGARP